MKQPRIWLQRRKRLFEIVEVGAADDWISRGYDMLSTLILVVNLTVTVMNTFDAMSLRYGAMLKGIESFTVAFFAVDYVLRLLSCRFLRPAERELKSLLLYMFSFTGVVDLLSFLPYYLPFFFPDGAVAFRMFRVIRIFRLFRINAYYDSLNVITEVLTSKKQQLLSSVFILLVLMLGSSLCMYSLEHEAQPEVFRNAFSGIWWSVSTLLTVGYGDIYPVTTLGKLFGTIIAFLGVGMVAIPTGIISAGFVDQYSRLKRISEYAEEEDIQFIKVRLWKHDPWVGREIKDLCLPHGMIVAMIRRGKENVVPRGDVVLKSGDTIILGAEALKDSKHIELKELILGKQNAWNGRQIQELDISRQTIIVMVQRHGTMLIPRGDLVLLEGDHVILYSQSYIPSVKQFDV
ncbi:MAG: ion transporter [Oscillospiraceae bacterium]|nr:ion transporter [Oscillospiraceae bacterium]